jgi:phage gp37-like protein
MATNTTKLGLIKPDLTDIVDIGDLNDNADDIDAAVGAAIVTSTTRPTSPWTGQIIHETDTDLTLVWDGSGWVSTGGADLEDLSDVTVTSGASGDALVYNGSGWVNQPRAGRNLLYNGAMQVHQRGTSRTGLTASGYYTADRWKFEAGSMGTWTETIENDAPTGSGFRKSLKILCTTADAAPAAGDFITVRQVFEGQDLQNIKKGTASAEQLTLSFWVKSNVTGTYISNVFDVTNNRSVSLPYSVNSSGVWEKKTILFPADTTGALDNSNAAAVILDFWLGAGSNRTSGTLQTAWGSYVEANLLPGQTNLAAATNNYWQVTGVQLEVGPVATPFEFKPYGQELLECQRYYYRISGDAFGPGMCTTTTAGLISVTFPTVMRIRPTALEQSGTAGDYVVRNNIGTAVTCTAVPAYNGSTGASVAVCGFTVGSGLSSGNSTILYSNNTNAFLGWSTEL